MRLGDPLDADPCIRPLEHFQGARDASAPRDRLAEVRRRARRFHEEMLEGEPVPYYRSFDLARVPYPTRYALRDACRIPMPLLHILNRLFVVQYRTEDGVRTLLISPSDVFANRETPFFRRMADRLGPALSGA